MILSTMQGHGFDQILGSPLLQHCFLLFLIHMFDTLSSYASHDSHAMPALAIRPNKRDDAWVGIGECV